MCFIAQPMGLPGACFSQVLRNQQHCNPFWTTFPIHDYVEELELFKLHRIFLGVIISDSTSGLGISTAAEIKSVDIGWRGAHSSAIMEGSHKR